MSHFLPLYRAGFGTPRLGIHSLLAGISLLLVVSAARASETSVTCPIMTDNEASEQHHADHDGLRYYFCCDSCVSDFQSDPSRFTSLSTVQGYPIDGSRTPWTVSSAAGPSLPSRFGGWIRYKIERHCIDDHLVQVHLFVFLGILCSPMIRAWRLRHDKTIQSFGDRLRSLFDHRSVHFATGRQWAVWLILTALVLDTLILSSYAIGKKRELEWVLAGREQLEAGREASEELTTRDYQQIRKVHYSTFVDYGFPPKPQKQETHRSLARTYYRGNDERHPEMFNGGQYRTVTFELSLETADGQLINYDTSLDDKPAFLKVTFIRAPHTSSGYFTTEYMQRMYLSMQADQFLGRDSEIPDRQPWTEVEPQTVWEARYQLPQTDRIGEGLSEANETSLSDDRYRGIVYLCEERIEDDEVAGGRYHFAVQYDLSLVDGRVSETSDLFMGTNYRGRNFTKYKIQEDQWLSTTPIPEKPHE